MEFERQYGVSTQVEFPLLRTGEMNFNDDPPSFVTGDVRLHKYTNETGGPTTGDATNLPSHVEKGTFRLVLTDAETQCKRLTVLIIDQTDPKAWEDQQINITFYGNSDGQHARNRNITDDAFVSLVTAGVDDSVIESEGSITRQQAESIILAALAGVTTDQGSTFKTPNGNAVRIIGRTETRSASSVL